MKRDPTQPQTTRRPTHSEHRVLVALSEHGGSTSGQIARALGYTNIRSEAQLVTRELRALSEHTGWVAQMDDQRPICWVRTPAGTEAMNVGA